MAFSTAVQTGIATDSSKHEMQSSACSIDRKPHSAAGDLYTAMLHSAVLGDNVASASVHREVFDVDFDEPKPRARRFTFGHSDKVNQSCEQEQKRNSLPSKLLHGVPSVWSSVKTQSPQPSPHSRFKGALKRSNSTSSIDKVKLSKDHDGHHHHQSAGVLHSISHKIHDKARKLLHKIRLGMEHECEILRTGLTMEQVHQLEVDHAREIIKSFLVFGQVTATAEPEEADQDLVLQAFPLISLSSCLPEVHSEFDRLKSLDDLKAPAKADESNCDLAISYAETVNQLPDYPRFFEFSTSPKHRMKEITDGVPDFN